ncbi:MAG: hypothetical protein ACRYGR_03785 [Janthinobacterium lividum]
MYIYKKFLLSMLFLTNFCFATDTDLEDPNKTILQLWRDAAVLETEQAHNKQASLWWDLVLQNPYKTKSDFHRAATSYYRSGHYNKAVSVYEKLVGVENPTIEDCRNFLICFKSFAQNQEKFDQKILNLLQKALLVSKDDNSIDGCYIDKAEAVLKNSFRNLTDPEQREIDFHRQACNYFEALRSSHPENTMKYFYKLGKLHYNYALTHIDILERSAYLRQSKEYFKESARDKSQPYLINIKMLLG